LRDHEVLERGHPGEEPDVLEGARDPGLLGDAEPFHLLEEVDPVGMVQREAPRGRLVEAGEAVEDRGLAGAVRADDRGDLALVGGERKIRDGNEAAEAHDEVLDLEQRRARAHAPLPFGWSRTEGSRWARSPRGRQTMIATIAAPNSSMRNSANWRPNSGRVTRTIAARTTPVWLPMPPSTTIARMIADSMKVKLSGLMKPWRVAKKAPAKPPSMAPIAKAESFVLVGLMPSARQAISSSRSASQARPIGSRRRRSVNRFVTSARARITK